MAKTPFIDDAGLKHLLTVAAISGESPERNVALLHVIYGTGMMLTEVATMRVSSYLKSNGEVLATSIVSAEIAYNGKERLLYWSNSKVIGAVDKYLDFRIMHNERTTTHRTEYRGLDPDGPIFLTRDGFPYMLTQRITHTGTKNYSCDSLSQLFRKLHRQAGIEGAGAMSGRRTFAVRLHQLGYDLLHISELLGHESLTATKSLIDAPPVSLGVIVAGVI